MEHDNNRLDANGSLCDHEDYWMVEGDAGRRKSSKASSALARSRRIGEISDVYGRRSEPRRKRDQQQAPAEKNDLHGFFFR